MEKDCQVARAKFIDKTVQLREDLSFANPDQILQAIKIFCSDAYGSMIWKLKSAFRTVFQVLEYSSKACVWGA